MNKTIFLLINNVDGARPTNQNLDYWRNFGYVYIAHENDSSITLSKKDEKIDESCSYEILKPSGFGIVVDKSNATEEYPLRGSVFPEEYYDYTEDVKEQESLDKETQEMFYNVDYIIKEDGFSYCFNHYSEWKNLKDKKFHELRKNYLESIEKLQEYINSKI